MDAEQLEDMRERILEYLTDTCRLLSRTSVNDGRGRETYTYPEPGTTLACRMQEGVTSESVRVLKMTEQATNTLILPYNANVKATDIIITSAGYADNVERRYEVIGSPAQSEAISVHVPVKLKT